MKKKVFSLMMTLLLAFVGVARANELTVHDGTTTSYYVPGYVAYYDDWTRSQHVFPAADLAAMAGGQIQSIKWYTNSNNIPYTTVVNVDVYVKEVASTGISAYVAKTDCQIVYTGTLSFVSAGGGGECVVNFATPFAYNGGNLLIGIDNLSDAGYKFIYFYGETVSGASIAGSNASATGTIPATQRNFLPKTTFTYSGGSGGGAGDQIFAVQDGEIVDTVFVGPRPNGCWMEPFTFQIRNTGANTTINTLDWTPQEYFTLVAPELPVSIARNEDIDVQLATGTSSNTDWQMVAIYGEGRTAAIWNINVEPYDPAIPDVWELAYDFGTIASGFSYQGVPSQITPTVLHNDYTLPFPEIEEGEDAVYKFTVATDMIINAYVDENAENGKVALYTEDFNGEGGPMATNNYTGLSAAGGGGAAATPFEVQIGDGTSTTGYMPFYCFYNYSISQQLFFAAELEEAGVTGAPMTSLSWYCTASNGNEQSNITIWMANVEETAIGSSSTMTAGMSKVYTGNMTPTANAWNEFVFNEGTFAWDGHSNILVSVQRNNGSWASGINWQCGAQDVTVSGYSYNDSDGAYNMETTSYTFGSSGYSYGGTTSNRANIIMKGGNRSDLNNLTFNFEGGMAGWTTIDNDGDGHDWFHSSNSVALSGYDYTGLGHNDSDGFMLSASYCDITGDPYDADNYLVSPQKYTLGTDANVNFFFDYGSDAYPDYFEVCVATANNPTANDFTAVWDIDMRSNAAKTQIRHSNNRYENWREVTVDLSAYAGQEVWIAFHHEDYDNYELWIDDVTVNTGSTAPTPGPTPGPTPTPGTALNVSAGPVIENLPIAPGTYYLVASATQADYDVFINVDNMPCPAINAEGFAFNPQPADDEDQVEPNSVTLRWMVPEYATGWRLIFGTTYYPDPNHPQTVMYPEDGSFTDHQMATSYTVRNLWNNTNYFWRVEFNNDACPGGVSSPIWGFTTHLNVPQNLVAADETVFNDEQIVLSWNAVQDRTYRKYNVYRDGQLIGSTQTNNINATTYTDGPLAYNMGGYTYYVTAVYDEGESAPSNTVNVKVSGYGDVNGHVYEQDGTTGIAGATVTMVGVDEFNVSHTYNFQTNSQGYYSGHIYAGTYNGSASCNGYQTIDEPVQGNPIDMVYNQTTSPIDYILDENFDPVCTVIAEYYPDSLDPNSPFVKVYWGCGLPGEEIVEPFETGDFSLFDWQIDPTYPWVIDSQHAYEGNYCMKSGNQQVLSSTSTMQVTVNIPADGIMSFFGKISCESGWDYGYFYIDGVQKGSYTGEQNWAEKKFDITAGDHTFKWEYTEDFMISQGDDCFYVDYITFYKRPEPAQPGWHTYCESEFNNALGSNLTTTPSWAYEYPASFLHTNYAGWNMTKVSLFSDNMYSAVGGNYTCRIYVGGTQPAAGTMVSTLTVDVPSNQNAWVDWDLTTPVNITGNDAIWVVWTANSTVSSWPAGLCGDQNDFGNWWDGGNGWEHQTYGTWTMRHWFTNRAGRSVAVEVADNAPVAVAESNINSKLRTYVKGEESNDAICVNPNAVKGASIAMESTRSLDHYNVYRTNCYNDGPYTEENTVFLATVWVPDTVYIDVEWYDLPAGVYKWGVGAVYSGNRGEEIAAPIHWSEPVNVGNSRATLTYDFDDNTMAGWTSIDADGDGNGWVSSSNPGIYHNSGVNLSGTGHNSSEAYMISGSYANQTGQALYPDNYLVSPQIALGGSITFYACAQDASYAAEHFGVAVSTTSNTSASAFTTIQEWTMTAKGSSTVKTVGRDGNIRQGNWYEYTVDLSAYSGNGYVAIRHFNCSDEFILNVDDITIVEGAGGSGGGGGNTNNLNQLAEERESETIWSNCLDKDMYLAGDVTVNVLLNSADSPEGVQVTFTNYNEYEQQTYGGYDITLDESGFYAFESFRKGEYKVDITFDGYEPIEDSVSIWEPTDLRYVMIEIIYGVSDLYVSSTGWAMWGAMGAPVGPTPGPGGNGDTFSVNFDDSQIPAGWTTIDGGSPQGYGWQIGSTKLGSTGNGHNGSADLVLSQSYDNNYGVVYPDNYLVSPQVTLAAGSTFSFWACAQDSGYPQEHFGVAVSDNGTSNWTMVNEWTLTAKGEGAPAKGNRSGRAQGNWYQYTVDLSSFAGQKYVAIRHFSCSDWFYLDVDDIELTNGAKAETAERHLEHFKVLCTSIDGEPIFNTNVPAEQPFCQLATDDLVPGDHYICKVAAMYSTGMSDWTECEWQYIPCDNYAGTVNGVTVEGNEISWDYPGGSPTPGPGGQGDTFSVNFDDSQMPAGWTVIDGGSPAGYGWQIGSTKLGSTGNGHNGSADLILSQSYDNNYGVVYPDNWFISPAVTLANGSQFSFWACGQDAGYAAEHCGVFVSTTGTNPSDFTMVNEWTLSAKGSGEKASVRGTRDQGTWRQYTVDLSNYAGEGRHIAIRHFNCSDMFYLDVDDVELTAGGKNGREVVAFNGFVTDAGAMSNGGDASWIKGSQSTFGPGCQQTSGNMVGDSFTLTAATTISEIEVYGYQTGSSQNSTFTGLYAQIYDGNPMSGGNVVWGDINTNIMTATAFTNCYRGSDGDATGTTRPIMSITAGNLSIDLAAGTYYLVYQLTGTGSSGPWATPHAEPTIGNTGNGVQFLGSNNAWQNLTDSGAGTGYGIAMKITGAGGTGPTPTPTGDVLGAMIFADGEWEAFVEYPTNTYTYEGNAEEVCVRIVYNGTNTLPEGNIYFSMSCPECEPFTPTPGTCEAGEPIHGDMHDGQVRVWWGEQPAAPIAEWLYYDDGENVDAIGLQNGGAFYWGFKIPAAMLANYAGCSVTKVAYYDYAAHSGVVRIYQGSNGNGPSTNMIGSYNYTANGTEDWVEWNITPASFDNTQDLWVVMNNSGGGQYVAALGNYTGDPNGTMISTDGSTWYTLSDATGGQLTGTWNLRCYVTNQAKGDTQAIEMPLPAVNGGELVNAGVAKGGSFNLNRNRANRVQYNVYRSTDNATYEFVGSVPYVEGQTYYEYIETPAVAGTYFYQVRALYDDDCESEPAQNAEQPELNYVQVSYDAIAENSVMAVYPNPTKGNVTIEAVGMRHITVVSTLGQVVFDADVEGDSYIMNMTQYTAGMYTVRVVTENGVSAQRITVIR